ncbi:hypothetical protein BDD12DRAFT_885934 [Trichophaea hybrida]|nr:hypothetical protein BDD12DRAFT_885934 [Trichophaea hybrida]
MAINATGATNFFICLLVMQVIMTLCLPLRFYLLRKNIWIRTKSTLNLWSDGFFVFGWALVMGFGWYVVHQVWEEVSSRKAAKSEHAFVKSFVTEAMAKGFLAIYILAVTEIWSVKAAFIFMYADLYSRTVNVRKHALYATAAFIPLTYIGLIITALKECTPFSDNWNIQKLFETGVLCSPITSSRTNIVSIIFTITTDIMLILLPFHIMTSLTLSAPQKRGITFIFAIAAISVSAAFARFVILSKMEVYLVFSEVRQEVTFEKYYWAVGLAFLEICAAEIAFVLPALRSVLVERRKRCEKEVTLVRIVGDEEDGAAVVDRVDDEAKVWGFGR